MGHCEGQMASHRKEGHKPKRRCTQQWSLQTPPVSLLGSSPPSSWPLCVPVKPGCPMLLSVYFRLLPSFSLNTHLVFYYFLQNLLHPSSWLKTFLPVNFHGMSSVQILSHVIPYMAATFCEFYSLYWAAGILRTRPLSYDLFPVHYLA
jgi:hypothetical protein